MTRLWMVTAALVWSCVAVSWGAPGPARPETVDRARDPNAPLKESLLDGNVGSRCTAMQRLDHATLRADPSFLDVFEKCADDPERAVRQEAARVVGGAWVWNQTPQHPRAIALSMKLARDEDRQVRHYAVYFGLSTVRQKSDDVIRTMLDAGMSEREFDDVNTHGRIAWGLRAEPRERLAGLFEPYLKQVETNEGRGLIAYATFVLATGTEPPEPRRFEKFAQFVVLFGSDPKAPLTAQEMLREFHSHVPDGLAKDVAVLPEGRWLRGAAVVEGLEKRNQVYEKLKASRRLGVSESPIVFTERRRLQMLAAGAVRSGKEAVAAPVPAAAAVNYEKSLRDLHEHLGQRYPSFALKGIDWKKVGQELLPLAAKVKTDEEFGILCLKLVARLEDSHALVAPGSAKLPVVPFPQWDVGIACLIDDRDRPVVFYVETGGPADGAGVRPGMAVLSVNGRPAAEALDEHMKLSRTYWGYSSDRLLRHSAARMFTRTMERGSKVKLELEGVDGKKRTVDPAATLGVRYVPRLPVPIEGIKDAADVSWKRLDGDVGYIYIRRIRAGLEEALDRAVKELADAKGLIVDVRGNTGGGFDAKRAVRNFDPNDPEEPQRPRYKGPIAVLIDEGCISAGEGWASWFVAKKRAKLYGSATAGASGRKETYTLSNGLYQVTFPVKAYTGFLDRPIERRGLAPDVAVRQNAKDLAAGRDSVLEAAKRELSAKQQ